MVTWKQVIERHGEEMAEKMIATGLLDAIISYIVVQPIVYCNNGDEKDATTRVRQTDD